MAEGPFRHRLLGGDAGAWLTRSRRPSVTAEGRLRDGDLRTTHRLIVEPSQPLRLAELVHHHRAERAADVIGGRRYAEPLRLWSSVTLTNRVCISGEPGSARRLEAQRSGRSPAARPPPPTNRSQARPAGTLGASQRSPGSAPPARVERSAAAPLCDDGAEVGLPHRLQRPGEPVGASALGSAAADESHRGISLASPSGSRLHILHRRRRPTLTHHGREHAQGDRQGQTYDDRRQDKEAEDDDGAFDAAAARWGLISHRFDTPCPLTVKGPGLSCGGRSPLASPWTVA